MSQQNNILLWLGITAVVVVVVVVVKESLKKHGVSITPINK